MPNDFQLALSRQPLTPEQRMFWTARQLRPDRPVDNRVMKLEWKLELDTEAFRRALQSLVDRTDALRLVFGVEKGTPFQSAVHNMDAEFTIRDFSSQADSLTAANQWLDRKRSENAVLDQLSGV